MNMSARSHLGPIDMVMSSRVENLDWITHVRPTITTTRESNNTIQPEFDLITGACKVKSIHTSTNIVAAYDD